MGVAPVAVCRGLARRESLPAPATGSLHRARWPAAAGRRGDPVQPGVTGQALRLAQRASGRAAGNDDRLASRRLETALADEVSARPAADPDGTARTDPQDGPGERVMGKRANRQRTAAQVGGADLATHRAQVHAQATSRATPRGPALVDVLEESC